MRIVVDLRCLARGRRTGVEEYAIQLLDKMLEMDKKNEYVLFLNSWKKTDVDLAWALKYPHVKIKKFNYPNKILNFFVWYFSRPYFDKLCGGADVVFMPNITFGSVSRKVKLILTIHDLSFERESQFFSRKRRWWHIFVNPQKICRRADQVIAVSDSTKNDLISIYGINPSKIETVLSAIGENLKPLDRNDLKLLKIKEKYSLPYKFILFFGTIEPRKNISGLLDAFEILMRKNLEEKNQEIEKYHLVIAGEKGWKNEEIFEKIKNSNFRERIKIIQSIPQEDKIYLYNLSSLFVYPSFFEGFGFPPLEAMRCGVPVICSNNSSLPEVVGKAAIMIDPDKPDEIYRAMKEILTDKKLRDKLVQMGLERAKEFSWKKTAEEVLGIINSML